MAPQSAETFGGRHEQQGTHTALETDLLFWAEETGFSTTQAQAHLCEGDIYSNSYRQKLLIPHEFDPGAVQEYNKSVPKGSKVTPVKVFLNPMHWQVQQAYFKAKVRCSDASSLRDTLAISRQQDSYCALMLLLVMQGSLVDDAKRQGRAHEHFQLSSKDMQDKLNKYLLIPKIQQQMPKDSGPTAQLSYLTGLVCGRWLGEHSHRLSHLDVTSGKRHQDTATEIVHSFNQGTKHALQAWSDPAQALENIDTLLRHLHLKPVHDRRQMAMAFLEVNSNCFCDMRLAMCIKWFCLTLLATAIHIHELW